MVRGTVVTGIRSRWVVRSHLPRPPLIGKEEGEGDGSAGVFVLREGQRWMVIPRRFLRPEVVGTEIWIGPSIGRKSFQRIAAEVWLSTAP